MTARQELSRPGLGLADALPARVRQRIGFAGAHIMTASVGQLRRFSRLPRAFTVRAATCGDEPALAAFSGRPDKIRRLLASGDLGLIAESDGRIHAMEWIRFGPAEYDWDAHALGVVFRVPSGYCWLHNGSGNGLGPWGIVLGQLPALLEARGVENVCLQVASDNTYSRQCHESIGFRRGGWVAALRVRKRPMVWLQTHGTRSLRFREVTVDLDRLVS